MTHNYITIFRNASSTPVGDSEPVECDIASYMGEPSCCAGSLIIYAVGEFRVILSNDVLTTEP